MINENGFECFWWGGYHSPVSKRNKVWFLAYLCQNPLLRAHQAISGLVLSCSFAQHERRWTSLKNMTLCQTCFYKRRRIDFLKFIKFHCLSFWLSLHNLTTVTAITIDFSCTVDTADYILCKEVRSPDQKVVVSWVWD